MDNVKIKIHNSVILDIIEFAKSTYPKEFFAYLEGKIKDDEVVVENVAYHPFESTINSAVATFHLGTNTNDFIGSVHSHPGGVNLPSRQDVRSFSKEGGVHMIISHPFSEDNIKCFTYEEKEISFDII